MERQTEDPKLFTKRELDLYTAHILKHLEARILSHDVSDETGDEVKATHLRMVRAWQRNEELPTVQWAEMIADTYNTVEQYAEEKQRLVDAVIEEIKVDIANGDVTAIDELLMFLPVERLKVYLPIVLDPDLARPPSTNRPK